MTQTSKKKKNFLRTDRRTDGQPKTIVRNLTKEGPLESAYFRIENNKKNI